LRVSSDCERASARFLFIAALGSPSSGMIWDDVLVLPVLPGVGCLVWLDAPLSPMC
jgi:hypothetical protein